MFFVVHWGCREPHVVEVYSPIEVKLKCPNPAVVSEEFECHVDIISGQDINQLEWKKAGDTIQTVNNIIGMTSSFFHIN